MQPTNLTMPSLEKALIEKYNRSGPRYTSYPTALGFEPLGEQSQVLQESILQNRDTSKPLSLYAHIPFCTTLCYYCACNKIITKKNSNSGDYLIHLFAEIAHKRRLLTTTNASPKVEQVHLGGGTPTFLSDDELAQLWQYMQSQFDFSSAATADYSVEIDPRALRENTLQLLRSLGVNRISFGVQDLEESVQIAVNRVQPESLIASVMNTARQLNYHSINMDLIYGLPKQTPKTLARTLDKIIEFSPDRLSVFNYAHLPSRFTSQKRIKDEDMPTPAEKLEMLSICIEKLNQAGYQYIGIDHFAKPTDSLAIAQQKGELHRNFQGYTTHGNCDLLGFGVSSISQIENNGQQHYLQNSTVLADYVQQIENKQLPAAKHMQSSMEDELRRHVIMQLLCHDAVQFAAVNSRFGIDFASYFAAELAALQPMQADELVTIDAASIRILPRGRLLARNVVMVFDAYLAKQQAGRYSKVI